MKPGEKIRYFRKGKGLNQDEFAQRLGFSDGYVSEIETGEKEPSNKFLNKMEEIFRVPREYILYSGTHLQWENIEADLKMQGLDDSVLEKIKPHCLAALVLNGKEEFERGFTRGIVACEPQMEWYTSPTSIKKLLDNARKILESDNRHAADLLEASIKGLLPMVSILKTDDEDKGGEPA